MKLKQKIRSLINIGIEAADPYKVVREKLSINHGILSFEGHELDTADYNRIYVAGIGKAAGAMAKALEEIIEPTEGCIITKGAPSYELETISVLTGGHPHPTKEGLRASKKLLDLAERIEDNELLIFLVSGGGSSLFCAPVEEISLKSFKQTNRLLLQSGATIQEINAVRKHLSRVKGGRFAQLVAPSTMVSLVLSDVVGDNLNVVASGPTLPDETKFEDALSVLKKYELSEKVDDSIIDYLTRGVEKRKQETLKRELPNVYNMLVGNNLLTLKSVKEAIEKEAFNAFILSSQIEGEAREIGKVHAGIAKEIQDSQTPISTPGAIISGGEATVTLNDQGIGGPNREFVLSVALKIRGKKIAVGAVDTDGIDGTGKSGAVADGSSIVKSKLDPIQVLRSHNTEYFFEDLGDSISLGKTGTNVNDLRIILIT